MADQEPDVEQLEVGGGGEDLPHVDDDSGQNQHGGQVHTQGSFKEGWFEECQKFKRLKLEIWILNITVFVIFSAKFASKSLFL